MQRFLSFMTTARLNPSASCFLPRGVGLQSPAYTRMIGTMICTKCKTKAVLKLPRHNAAFCKDCFNSFVQDQVLKAIRTQEMFTKNDRLLVAVSGGKDSLALWAILLKLGYNTDALYVNLGIGGYSESSQEKVVHFSETVAVGYGAVLHVHT